MKKVSVLFATNSPLTKGMSAGRSVAKKIIIAIMCVLGIATAYAENENAATSKEYVDTELAAKQPTIPAEGNDVVMTFDSTAMDGIGTKQIYDESASYAEQQNALVTAGTANAAVQMAIQGEFVCTRYSDIDPTDCWLWGIKSVTGYTELEYLESTGAQWINTGVLSTHNVGVSVKYAFMELTPQTYIFGSYEPHYYLGINSMGTNMGAMYHSASGGAFAAKIPYADVVIGQPYELNINYYNSGTAGFVGMASNQLKPETFASKSTTMYMFAANTIIINGGGSDGTFRSKSRIYYMRITDGTTLVRNFMPVRRDSDGKLGMYDTVTNTFYTNDGTGTFIAGPVASFMPQNQ